jgi:V/A-type H+-transporting ATPase subunit D
MAIVFQYNKIARQALEKQLKMRERALPTLKNKESALRMEVKRCKDKATELEKRWMDLMEKYDSMMRLWGEFDPNLVRIKDVELLVKKIAGVGTPLLEKVEFEVVEIDLYQMPVWFPDGVRIIKDIASVGIEHEVMKRKMELLEFARRKTTQKVNLYEKVQIPGFQDAILKIKRFLEDEENLSKSAQKIVKNRQQSLNELL